MTSHARRFLQAARFAALFTIPVGCMALTACAGDDTNPAAPSADSGVKDATTSGSSSGGSSSGSVDASADSGHHFDGGGCREAPTLHAAGSAGPYCPFIDGGAATNCAADQLCCIDEDTTGDLNSSCQTASVCAAPTKYFFQCSGPSNCSAPSGTQNDAGVDGGDDGGDAAASDSGASDSGSPVVLCCGIGPAPTVTAGCTSADLETDLSATVCATSCDGLDDGGAALIICDTATGECPAGMTCTPFRTHGSELGYCM